MNDIDTDTLLSRGFDAGNYANAYTSTRLFVAWEAECKKKSSRTTDPDFRAAFVIGFFSSYEEHEIPAGRCRDEYIAAIESHGPRMREIGIAVD